MREHTLGAASRCASPVLLAAIALAGCSTTLGLVLPNDKGLQLVIYAQGSPTQQCVIDAGSSPFVRLEKLLAANRNDWKLDPNTYVPSVLVMGSGFGINFRNDFVVVNYAGRQLSRALPRDNYAFLACEAPKADSAVDRVGDSAA